MSIEAMKQALEALENHTAIKHPQQMHYWESAVDALRQAIEEAEKTTVDCNTCENRGVLIPLAQETYCENCIYGSSWKKNYYKEKNHEH
jgi:prefoldin subunit 5